ncbi:MAG: phosphoenolpyruvate--protein phosphotransferase [Blastocatellia bacterium]|nr:phosphoenolpyruvate--protein phosphotransferase [Blastocatellia bacterium]
MVKNRLVLKAPVSGLVVPLEEVPDPVFSQRIVGDGTAIDPISQSLFSPCDGEVVQLHSATHAITIKTAEDIEILLHIGIDTVKLKGKGFHAKVKIGDKVTTGTPLIDFEADPVAKSAVSLLTTIIIPPSEKILSMTSTSGVVEATKDDILTLLISEPEKRTASQQTTDFKSQKITISNHLGLHARPAAVLASGARKFKAEILLCKNNSQANAKSVTAIMSLEIAYQDSVLLIAKGNDAEIALETLQNLIKSGLGEQEQTDTNFSQANPTETIISSNTLIGINASPGSSVGKVLQLRHQEFQIKEVASSEEQERKRFETAIEKAKLQLETLQKRLDGTRATIFAAHIELLEDPELIEAASTEIESGKSAAFAWNEAFNRQAEKFIKLQNPLIAQRAVDVRDVGKRVLTILTGSEQKRVEYPKDSILIAEELTPSDIANIDKERVLGICTTGGSVTPHVAIMARALSIPATVAIDPRALELEDGQVVIIDNGRLIIEPSVEEIKSTEELKKKEQHRQLINLGTAHLEAITVDGVKIDVFANVGSIEEARSVNRFGGEGIGLLRTEFLFLNKNFAPTQDEQFYIYKEIAESIGKEKLLIIRTLDVGGDKPLPYISTVKEENPFLGERGVRLMLAKSDLFLDQLRAILRASHYAKVAVMFPMISELAEIVLLKEMLAQESKKLGIDKIRLGIMVEVPAVALMAQQFAKEVDFFSIGTNDLTQYTLAIDRTHPKLASKVDALNPAVLNLIKTTAIGASIERKLTGVCGALASDLTAVPLLLGLGITELSASLPAIPEIKALIRTLNLEECRKTSEEALKLRSGKEVRQLFAERLRR